MLRRGAASYRQAQAASHGVSKPDMLAAPHGAGSLARALGQAVRWGQSVPPPGGGDSSGSMAGPCSTSPLSEKREP